MLLQVQQQFLFIHREHTSTKVLMIEEMIELAVQKICSVEVKSLNL